MPNDRYGSVEEFARDAVQAVGGVHATPTVDTEGETQQLDMSQHDQQTTEQLPKTRVSGAKPTLPLEQSAAAATVTPDTPLPLTQHSPRDKKKAKKPVVAFAASLVVVAAGVGAAAVAFSGDEEQPARSGDSTQFAGNTPVTPIDTAEGGSGGQQEEDSGEQQTPPVGGGEATRDTNDPALQAEDPARSNPPTTVDSAAIDAELGAMIEGMEDPDSRPRLMVRAEDIYRDTMMPANLRGSAAAQVGFGHLLNSDRRRACEWIDRAIVMRPDNSLYKSTRVTWECPL